MEFLLPLPWLCREILGNYQCVFLNQAVPSWIWEPYSPGAPALFRVCMNIFNVHVSSNIFNLYSTDGEFYSSLFPSLPYFYFFQLLIAPFLFWINELYTAPWNLAASFSGWKGSQVLQSRTDFDHAYSESLGLLLPVLFWPP